MLDIKYAEEFSVKSEFIDQSVFVIWKASMVIWTKSWSIRQQLNTFHKYEIDIYEKCGWIERLTNKISVNLPFILDL